MDANQWQTSNVLEFTLPVEETILMSYTIDLIYKPIELVSNLTLSDDGKSIIFDFMTLKLNSEHDYDSIEIYIPIPNVEPRPSLNPTDGKIIVEENMIIWSIHSSKNKTSLQLHGKINLLKEIKLDKWEQGYVTVKFRSDASYSGFKMRSCNLKQNGIKSELTKWVRYKGFAEHDICKFKLNVH